MRFALLTDILRPLASSPVYRHHFRTSMSNRRFAYRATRQSNHRGICMSRIGVVLLVAMAARIVNAAEPSQVIVDPSRGYATVFISLAEGDSPKALLEQEGAFNVGWSEFKAHPEKYITAYIRRNDEPGVDVSAGLLLLLKENPGQRFGLTWNGSLAFSSEDFRFAEGSYRQYRDDPEVVAVPAERRRSPGRAPITPGVCDRYLRKPGESE
jgi:hypothetical protein